MLTQSINPAVSQRNSELILIEQQEWHVCKSAAGPTVFHPVDLFGSNCGKIDHINKNPEITDFIDCYLFIR